MTAKERKVVTIIKQMIEEYPINKEWTASEFISTYWGIYKSDYKEDNSVNGGVFEQLLVLSLLREEIGPVYVQAKLAFVPNVILDIVLYNRRTPITISAKTSLRERWKQADLEAVATKYVHRDAKCYLLTLSESEVKTRRTDRNSYMGIDKFILAHTTEYDQFINDLKQIEISESETIKIIETDHHIYNKEIANEMYKISL